MTMILRSCKSGSRDCKNVMLMDFPATLKAQRKRNHRDIETETGTISQTQECQARLGIKKEIPKEISEPPSWRTVWENIVTMRKNRDAPVDIMGAETYMDNQLSPQVARFQVLVSLLLSSQTKDAVTHAAMQKLISHGLTIDVILQTELAVLEQLIYPVGFWKKKAVYLKKTAEILKTDFESDVPCDIEKLCQLPGVGPKMAYLCVTIAWNQNVGIGVDTHVHRISNRLKWTGVRDTKTPEETRKQLEQWLPKEFWKDINVLLVGFGQQICLPVKPRCDECSNNQICPSRMSCKKKTISF